MYGPIPYLKTASQVLTPVGFTTIDSQNQLPRLVGNNTEFRLSQTAACNFHTWAIRASPRRINLQFNLVQSTTSCLVTITFETAFLLTFPNSSLSHSTIILDLAFKNVVTKH